MTKTVTGKEIDEETVFFLIDYVRKGEESYSNFRTTRLLDKAKKLFDPIQKIDKIKKVSAASKNSRLTLRKKLFQPFGSSAMPDCETIALFSY